MSQTATTLTGGQHGTKWIGGLTIASAIISSLDPNMLPPSWLPWVSGALGAITLARGVINTQNAQKPQS
jgi:hypothetical protein